jgi:maltose alpha-D-glucosyltransferase/alpha-amylase
MDMTTWLNDSVLYQIYPQSFADSDGDGIGDLRGIAEHLDYLAWLGVTAVWLNPCFVSPMRDAGYDIADYFTVDPRYGDNDDLAKLVDQARARGIRLLLDLVPGHTADTHPWFVASAHGPGDHRYIWANAGPDGRLPERFVRSPGSRPGGYLPNFFDFQPALNYGYARQKADEPWRQSTEAEGPRANRAALRTIMGHWLGLGVSGFRVDMAYSLVKDDPGLAETARLWPNGATRQWPCPRGSTPTSSSTSAARATAGRCARCGTTAPRPNARNGPRNCATSTPTAGVTPASSWPRTTTRSPRSASPGTSRCPPPTTTSPG